MSHVHDTENPQTASKTGLRRREISAKHLLHLLFLCYPSAPRTLPPIIRLLMLTERALRSPRHRVSHFMVLPLKSHCAQKTKRGRGGANQCGHRLTPGDASQLKELASPGGDSPGRSSAPTTAKERRQARANDVKTSCMHFQNKSFALRMTSIWAA